MIHNSQKGTPQLLHELSSLAFRQHKLLFSRPKPVFVYSKLLLSDTLLLSALIKQTNINQKHAEPSHLTYIQKHQTSHKKFQAKQSIVADLDNLLACLKTAKIAPSSLALNKFSTRTLTRSGSPIPSSPPSVQTMPFSTPETTSLATTSFRIPSEGHHLETSKITADLNSSVQDCEGQAERNGDPPPVSFDKAVPKFCHAMQTENCPTTSSSGSEHSLLAFSNNVNYLDSRETSVFPTVKSVRPLDRRPYEIQKPMAIPLDIDQPPCTPNVERRLEELQCVMMKSLAVPNFIPLRAKASLLKSDNDAFSLADKVRDFLGTNCRQVLLLSGQAGSGKTAFCRNLVSDLWTDYKPGGRIPLFIDLPIVDKPQERLIYKTLRHHNFLDHEIQELLHKRQFVLVCDGYDESGLTSNLHARNCLNQPGQPRVKMIITCRSTFFGRNYQDRFYPYGSDNYHGNPSDLFEEASILPFTKGDVETFIGHYIHDVATKVPSDTRPRWTVERYIDTFTSIPELWELIATPFPLWLVLEILPSFSSDALEPATIIRETRAHLYQCFLSNWIAVRKNLCSKILDGIVSEIFHELCESEDGFEGLVIEFLTRLATEIFKYQGYNAVVEYEHSRDKASWKGTFFGSELRSSLLRDASPLLRVENRYMFLHSSFFAYFRSLTFDNDESEDKGDSDDDEDDDSGDEDDSDGDEDDDYGEGGDDGSEGAGLTDEGGSARDLSVSYAGGGQSTSSNGGSNDKNCGSSDGDGNSSGGNRDATDDHQGTSGGGGESSGGSGSSGEGEGNGGGDRDDPNGDKNDPRAGKDGSRSKKKNRATRSRPSTSSDPFSNENIFKDPQVLEFLVDRVRSNPGFKKRLLTSIDQSKSSTLPSLAAANAMTILFMSGERFREVDLDGVRVPSDYLLEECSESSQQSECSTGSDFVGALLSLEVFSATQISTRIPQPTSPSSFKSNHQPEFGTFDTQMSAFDPHPTPPSSFKTKYRPEPSTKDTRKYTCPYPGCHRRYVRKANAESHFLTHDNSIRFMCKYCSNTYARRKDCDRHENTVHRGMRWRCKFCGKALSRHPTITQHAGCDMTGSNHAFEIVVLNFNPDVKTDPNLDSKPDPNLDPKPDSSHTHDLIMNSSTS
ncbi:hypothetical protein BGW39_005465 [Mortierella sp. 14UC]|nr:hypothetical protein BGW39_005465 [Mortierella sp. 14UC]